MTQTERCDLDVTGFVERLDARLPLAWAEDWDRSGLLAGDPDAPVRSVLVTLDADRAAVRRAAAGGHSVLLTHHPAVLECGLPLVPDGPYGVVVDAIRAGVALVAMHTNLDRSPAGAEALAVALGLEHRAPLVPAQAGEGTLPSFGRLCELDAPVPLSAVAAKCGQVLGASARTWGAAERPVRRIALVNGSGGSFIGAALAARADVLVTGEVRYHDARAALDAGLAIVEAGHDASEWPLVRVLAHAAREAVGGTDAHIVEERPTMPWWTTERR